MTHSTIPGFVQLCGAWGSRPLPAASAGAAVPACSPPTSGERAGEELEGPVWHFSLQWLQGCLWMPPVLKALGFYFASVFILFFFLFLFKWGLPAISTPVQAMTEILWLKLELGIQSFMSSAKPAGRWEGRRKWKEDGEGKKRRKRERRGQKGPGGEDASFTGLTTWLPLLCGIWVGDDKCLIGSAVLWSFLPIFPARPCVPCRQGSHPVPVSLHCPA